MRQLAGSIGTAILVTVMTTQTTQHLSAFGEELDKTNPVVQDHMRELTSITIWRTRRRNESVTTICNKLEQRLKVLMMHL
ncbi:hypothetical protein ACVXZZ_04230 [Staphylococcus aureus]